MCHSLIINCEVKNCYGEAFTLTTEGTILTFFAWEKFLKKYVYANCVTSWKSLERCMKCKEFEGKYWKFAGIFLRNVIENLGRGNMSTRKLIWLRCNILKYIIVFFNNFIQESYSAGLSSRIIILRILKNFQTEVLFSFYLKYCALSISFSFSIQ